MTEITLFFVVVFGAVILKEFDVMIKFYDWATSNEDET